MKLTFEPVTNKIGNDFYIVPKNDADGVKCVMKCDEVGAFIVNLLVNDMKRDEMILAVSEHYPNATLEEVEAAVDGVRNKLISTIERKNEVEI